MKKGVYKLEGKIKNYDWGGKQFLPALLGMENKENKPFAEYWLGTHPSSPADVLVDGEHISMDKFLENNKASSIPFLFKVLDVKEMLSIQVHPDKRQAEAGFERENKEGIAVDSPGRNYRDNNHKPEVMVALSDFYLLHGFKGVQKTKFLLEEIPEFNFLSDDFEEGGYEALYKKIMQLPQDEVDSILKPIVERAVEETNSKDDPAYWVSKLYSSRPLQQIDRGVFSIFLFNLVHLKEGEGIFQGAGVPHAYLEGQCVELMANSDNVLRGGLTSKHIDVDELLKLVRYEATKPEILDGLDLEDGEKLFTAPVNDFSLRGFEFPKKATTTRHLDQAAIFIVTDGALSANDVQFKKGEAGFIEAGSDVKFTSISPGKLYLATTPELTVDS